MMSPVMSTEERLRAATRAAAGTVPPGSAPPLRLPGAQPGRARWDQRQRWLRAMVPLAAAAAVAAVVIVSLALTRGVPPASSGGGSSPARPAALDGVPPYYVALTAAATPAQAVIRSTATGAVLATVKPPRPYGTFMFVSGAADDRTFILAAQRYWPIASGARGLAAEHRDNTTPVVFFRLRFDPATRMARLTQLHPPEIIPAANLNGMGVSPDGSRLALVLNPAQIAVVTLANGASRNWVWPGPGHSGGTWVGNGKPSGQPVSWTADGRTVAFPVTTQSGGVTAVVTLDTRPARIGVGTGRRTVTFRGHGHVKPGPVGNALITPDGTRIVTVTTGPSYSQSRVTEFSVRTGRALRGPGTGRSASRLGVWDVLWTSADGSTLIVDAGPSPATGSGLGVLRAGRFTPLPGTAVETSNVAW